MKFITLLLAALLLAGCTATPLSVHKVDACKTIEDEQIRADCIIQVEPQYRNSD